MMLQIRSGWIGPSHLPVALLTRISALFLGLVLLAGCSASSENKVPMPQPRLPFTVSPTIELGRPMVLSTIAPSTTPTPLPPATSTAIPPSATPALPTLSPTPQSSPTRSPIEIPAADARVTLPLHLLARLGSPGDDVNSELRWQDGTTITQTFKLLVGEDQNGLLLANLDWQTESQPSAPPSQPATLTLRSPGGQVLAQQNVVVLSPSDPDARQITLYWYGGDKLYPAIAHIPRTPQIGAAAVDELLWGPPPRSLAGFTSALPTAPQVLSFAGRQPDWGPRVTLRKLTIVNGVATADFSKELRALGTTGNRFQSLRQQLIRTLTQFSTVREVRIAIEGKLQ
jgi:spore germination protein GerM